MKKWMPYLQYVMPQHAITQLMSYVGSSEHTWLKTKFINWFIKHYHVDMAEALEENSDAYPTFNAFFTRHLKPQLRPIVAPEKTICSPVDGTVAQIGDIQNRQLLQAKNMYFNLKSLLGNDEAQASQFENGKYCTLYLAPHNYHRVHMPFSGKLVKCVYVPGQLFSVNRMTSEIIPNLFSRNERLICMFETNAGLMSVIFVGALIVGSMQTVWMNAPLRGRVMQDVTPSEMIILQKGAELGWFLMGSTVLVLFQENKIQWQELCTPNSPIQYGQWLGSLIA